MDGLISIAIIMAVLLGLGMFFGLADRNNFSPPWLLIAILLVFANDAMLTNFFGLLPDAVPESSWNWQGKVLALALSLLVASTAAFGWTRAGLTLRQTPGSMIPAGSAFALYALFFLAIALAFPNEPVSAETLAFQLTMPGIEEEVFYRGILLLAFNEAFRGRWRFLGIGWGWGAIMSCIAFGFAHALSWTADAGANFESIYFALTAIPSLLAVWMRERTGSILLAVLAHNLGNSLSLLL